MTDDNEFAQRLYYAYNAGGDPATAGLNYRGEPCPAWADLPENVRAKWRAAFDAAVEFVAEAVAKIENEPEDDHSDTTWSIAFPSPLDYIPSRPPVVLSNFIIEQNLAGLPWRYGDHSEEIFADLADGITLYAECEGEPRVTVVADCDPDDYAATADEVLAFLNGVADTGTRCGEDVHYPTDDYRDAAIVLSQAMKKTAALRASRVKP
jgi:hypothetical protein